jgi:hypothetical protein
MTVVASLSEDCYLLTTRIARFARRRPIIKEAGIKAE